MVSQTSNQELNDERAIRELVDKWIDASKTGDHDTILGLMADDVIFMVPGREPFGKEAFAEGNQGSKPVLKDGTSEILEIKILGDWAWIRNHLKLTLNMPDGEVMRHSGYTLTILRRNPDGAWVLFRDANLVTADADA